MTTAQQRPSAPAAPAAPSAPSRTRPASSAPARKVPAIVPLEIEEGKIVGRDRIMIYGTGGVGKSTAAAVLPSPLFIDTEEGTGRLNVKRVHASEWMQLRGILAGIAQSPPQGIRTIVLDTITRAQAIAEEYVVATYKNDRGDAVDSIERFAFGKGWQFVADEMHKLFADLDRIAEAGLNICAIAHDVTSQVPNPGGEDYTRWEPNLYSGNKNSRGDIRSYAKGWADHVLFFGYDVAVRDGKAQGYGSRTIYTCEYATHVAKTRTFEVEDSYPFTLDDPRAIWTALSIS